MHTIALQTVDNPNVWCVLFVTGDNHNTVFSNLTIQKAAAVASYLNGGGYDIDVGEAMNVEVANAEARK